MVVSFQSIEKDSASAKSDISQNFLEDNRNGQRFELMTLLQSTLDLKTLLRFFLENLRKELPIDGVFFHEDERNIKIKLGRQSTHSCGYRLSNGENNCGEIIFKRNTRFNEQDLQAIENAALLLLVPIGNSLKYQDAVFKAAQNPAKQVVERAILHKTLNREIELAKRHNHPLSLISITVTNNSANKNEIDQFATTIYEYRKGTDLVYRTAARQFILVTPAANETLSATIDSIKGLNEQQLNSEGQLALELTIGAATVTGTDSLKSVMDRAKKQLEL